MSSVESELIEACKSGEVEQVEAILEKRPDLLDTPIKAEENEDARPPLTIAAAEGNLLVVMALLAKGADVTVPDEWSYTAISASVINNQQSVLAALLLAKGADINERTLDGVTALMFAVEKGNILMARFLLEWGADVNLMDYVGGQTALSRATALGNREMARVLR